jgi:hypothetical protein
MNTFLIAAALDGAMSEAERQQQSVLTPAKNFICNQGIKLG